MVSRWLIVRHAQTSWNLEGRIQGHIDIPLSEVGLRQTDALRDRLAGWDIHAAYASDLKRTMETARSILQGRSISPSPTPELREFSYGRWEGMTHAEVEEADPGAYAEMLKRREDFAPPGGESLNDLMVRVGGFVSRLKVANPDPAKQPGSFEVQGLRTPTPGIQGQVPAWQSGPQGRQASNGNPDDIHPENFSLLITGHGGSLRVLLTCLLELPASSAWRFFLAPASLSIVDCYADNSVLRLLNDTSTLP